jgi:hypothetical protein
LRKGRGELRLRTKIMTILISIVASVVVIGYLLLRTSDLGKVSRPREYRIVPYSYTTIDESNIEGVFTESILSTRVDDLLLEDNVKIVDTYLEYRRFCESFRDIYPTNPTISSRAKSLFDDGYLAILISYTDASAPCNLYATGKIVYEKTLTILLEENEINPDFIYNRSVHECRQVIAVAYVKSELLNQTDSLVVMLPSN